MLVIFSTDLPLAISSTGIVTGMLLGFRREDAARFSFLLSAPIVLAAGAYKLWKALPVMAAEPAWRGATAVGTVVSGVVGYAVIGWLLFTVRGNRLLERIGM